MVFDPLRIRQRDGADPNEAATPLGGTRAERLQRLQIGTFGIFAMVLLIGIADIVGNRIAATEATAVPEAAPTIAPTETPAARDPLVDAGVSPRLPVDPEASPGPTPPPTADMPQPASNAPLQ